MTRKESMDTNTRGALTDRNFLHRAIYPGRRINRYDEVP
jgi:hypothetical protein